MRTYGQYCPIARGAEIFAERWTPLIIRNLHLGCGSFGEILQGAPGLSRTLLSQRLKQLERLGIVGSAPKPDGRGRHYELTPEGHDLFKVCVSLGEWGAAWLEIAPEHLDPFVALWSMCNMLRRDRLPGRRVVIRFDFTDLRRPERYWLLIEHAGPWGREGVLDARLPDGLGRELRILERRTGARVLLIRKPPAAPIA